MILSTKSTARLICKLGINKAIEDRWPFECFHFKGSVSLNTSFARVLHDWRRFVTPTARSRTFMFGSVKRWLAIRNPFTNGPFPYRQVDKNLVLTKGREVAGKLLIELQVRKSTADGPGAREYYNNLTTPIAGWEGEIRDLVLAKKQVSGHSLTASLLTGHAFVSIATQSFRST